MATIAPDVKQKIDEYIDELPADLQKALAKNKTAWKFFDALTYGYKKEFVEHVTEAKREETRQQRIEKIVGLCAGGRKLNDKCKK